MVVVKFLHVESHIDVSSVDHLEHAICELYSFQNQDFYLICNGRKLLNDELSSRSTIHIVPRCLGGKGGFGSMLRAIGAQIEKTTNREACRDLSGRRLRDINEEKRLKNWISQKEEREREAREKKRRKLERLCQEPKVELKDEKYMKQRLELTDNINDSLEQGLKASTRASSSKRKCDEPTSAPKKKKVLMLDDIDLNSDTSSSDDETSNNTVDMNIKTHLAV